MAVLDGADYDLMQLWSIITQLGEQLSQNQSMSVSLYTMAGKVKNQSGNLQTGFVLRRFNLDKTQEEYDALLEQMNASISSENRALQHDNKQLSALIKEYEQTLESVMSTFRNRAQHVQEQELSLIRDFETKLLASEEANAEADLKDSSSISDSIARISFLFRQLLRAQGGEEMEIPASTVDETEEGEPWNTSQVADHALEREIELARLERENEELKRMLGLIPWQPRRDSAEFQPPLDNRRSGPVHIPAGHHPAGVINSGFSAPHQRVRSPG